MKSLVVFAFLIFSSHHLLAQHIIRSSIGSFSSTSKAGIHAVISGNPVSSPVLKEGNKSEGISIQTRPFVHLKSNQSAKDIVIDIYPNPSNGIVNVVLEENGYQRGSHQGSSPLDSWKLFVYGQLHCRWSIYIDQQTAHGSRHDCWISSYSTK